MARSQCFETGQWVPFPVELVFAFFANPANLPYRMPGALKVRIDDLRVTPPKARPVADDRARRFQSMAAGAGSEIAISFRPVAGVPFRICWRVRIVEFAWFHHFVEEQVRGPFALFRHRHGIEAETRDGAEGTRVSDRVEFALPGGWSGALAAGVVRQVLERQFAHCQQRLPEMLAAAARQAAGRRR